MQRQQSVPTNFRPLTPSILSSSVSTFEDDDGFSVVTFKKNRDRSHISNSSAADGRFWEVQDEDADAVANDNSGARRGRKSAKPKNTTRLVSKDGACHVSARNVRQRRKRYLVDIFTTLIDLKWRYCFVMFGLAFVGSWCLFAFFWWAIAMVQGSHLYPNSTSIEPCVTGVYDYLSALEFSVETQTTVGYGAIVIQPHCPHGTLLLMFQACFGILIQSLVTGLMFAKLLRPKRRAHTVMFSRHAVICLRDGEYCLLFRMGDMRSKHLIDTSIRALIVMAQRTDEEETIPLCQSDFTLETETNFADSFVFFVWPTTFVHRIVPGSPLYALGAEALLRTDFEIIVILEGVLESTGYCIQIRTSYLHSELLWGHRLTPLVKYEKCNSRYEIDFKQFHGVIPIASMPGCSAKEYAERSTERNDAPLASADEYPFSFTANDSCRTTSRTSLRRLLSRRYWPKTMPGGECISGRRSSGAATPARKVDRQLSADVYSKARKLIPLRKSFSHQ